MGHKEYISLKFVLKILYMLPFLVLEVYIFNHKSPLIYHVIPMKSKNCTYSFTQIQKMTP